MTSSESINLRDCKIAFFSPIVSDRDVLDLGVVQHDIDNFDDSNWLHRAIVSAARSCTGLDIDELGVEELRKRGFNVVCANAEAFELKEQFDVVVAGDIIEHLGNIGGFLDCVRKHMKPGGLFALSTPNPFWWKHGAQVVLKGRAVVHPQHTGWLCPQTLTQVLSRHGFSVTRMEFGSVYRLTTVLQRVTWLIDRLLPMPRRISCNTILCVARDARHAES